MLNPQVSKFDLRWTGPYYVVSHDLNGACFIMKPSDQRLDNPVSSDRLAPFLGDDVELFYSGRHPLGPAFLPAPGINGG